MSSVASNRPSLLMLVAFLAAALSVGIAPTARAELPTLVPIKIDGLFNDWQSVLVNPLNTTRDGDGSRLGCTIAADRDCPVQSTGRDLRLFAWTYDSLHVYFYVARQGSSSNSETFWFYVDEDGDGRLEAGENVVRVRYQGSSGDTSTTVFDYYLPSDPAGDPMTDAAGFADGYTMPGDLDPGAIWQEDLPDGGDASGSVFEARVPWSVLGIVPGSPISFHVASSNSPNPSNLSGQVDDNLGGLGGSIGTFAFSAVEIGPDNTSTLAGGPAVAYAHRITNTGTQTDSFALQVRSSLDLSIQIYHDTDGDGDGDVLIATDASGDGDFADAGDSISAGWDADGDGYPNTPALAPGETFDIVVMVATLVGQSDVTDVTTVFAFIAPARQVIDSAVNTTAIGIVTVRADQSSNTITGQATSYPVSVCNNGAADTFDIDVTSSLGLSLNLYSDEACDGIADLLLARDTNGDGTWDLVLRGDSDADGKPDTGLLSGGQCACFVVRVDPGASAIGSVDTTVITARGSGAAPPTAHADLFTTVARRIDLMPDYLVADGTSLVSGFGKPVFFAHVAQNNGASPDAVSFVSAVNDLGWAVNIWSDPNGDGSISDGRIITRTDMIAPFGGTQAFIVEVEAAVDATGGILSTTIVTGASVAYPSDTDTVTDQVELSYIATYRDPLFAFATGFFGPCDTIYVEGTGLERPQGGTPNAYEVIYYDAAGNVVRTRTDFLPDPQGESTDQYLISGIDQSGQWTVELRRDGEVLSSVTFVIEVNGQFTNLSTDRLTYPLSGSDLVIDATLVNGNVEAAFGNTTVEYVVLDPTGTMYLVPGAPNSAFAAYTGTESTRIVGLPPMAVGETFTDGFTSASVTYPMQGVYTLQALWRASCGTQIGWATTSFSVGSGVENCTNNTDDDGDGLIDCEDPECGLDPNCHESLCNDLVDNDRDGSVDCADSDCVSSPDCPEVICADGVDNDRDGDTDCRDSDCFLDPACTETGCSDGVDNDGDTFVDCADIDCVAAANCQPESICDDNIDNDSDTRIDCLDTDCVSSPACLGEDTDGDTVPNAEDCAPLDPGSHHVPVDVFVLMVDKMGAGSTVASLSWQDARAQAGNATVYDVAGGRISELWQDRGIRDTDGDGMEIGCIAQGRLSPTLLDSRRSAPGDGYYYLVAARNVCGDSGWGVDSTGVPRDAPTGLCGLP